MKHALDDRETTAAAIAYQSARWAAYAACAWAWVFAAMSFYWAAGGMAGLATLGVEIRRLALARDPLAVFIGGWGVGVAKVIGGLLALALVQPWRRRNIWRGLLVLAWAGGIGMMLYGIGSFVQHALMLGGRTTLPAGLGETGARWHLILWDPWWTLGGVLFTATAWLAGRSSLPA